MFPRDSAFTPPKVVPLRLDQPTVAHTQSDPFRTAALRIADIVDDAYASDDDNAADDALYLISNILDEVSL
jgi:hypothetical protein